MIHIETKAEFEELIKQNNCVVIDFFATWCGPCKMLSPIIEDVAKEREDITFVKVDVDHASELADLFGVMSIPTIVYIKNQALAHKDVGFIPKAKLLENLKTVF